MLVMISFKKSYSILIINEKFQLKKMFSFQYVSEAAVKKVVENLPSDKASAGEIPITILIKSKFRFPELTNCINESFTNNKFPSI